MKTAGVFIIMLIFSFCLPGGDGAADYEEIMNRVTEYKSLGDFSNAKNTIKEYLETRPDIDADEKRQLRYMVDRMHRIRSDYSLTEQELKEELRERVQEFATEEFEQWKEEGRISYRIIDGEHRYFRAAVSNLFFRYHNIRARRIAPCDLPGKDLVEAVQEISRIPVHAYQYYHSPINRIIRFEVKVTTSLKETDKIEVWIPFPRELPFQSDIRLLDYSPGLEFLSQPGEPMRTLYYSRRFWDDEALIFNATYSVKQYVRNKTINKEKIEPSPDYPPGIAAYLEERPPHVVFFPELQQKVDTLIKEKENPYDKARSIYDWIAEEFKYSYSRDYATIDNISRQIFENRYGDCGQLAILFITMCRYAGVPARWQSGWMLYPSHKGLHDWAEIYVEPYGWLPVDPWVPVLFNSSAYTGITEEQKQKTIDFYFGNMDAYRLVFNTDHARSFTPPKTDFRSDPVDSQRGEVQVNGENVYYDGFQYQLEVIREEREK